MRRLAGNLPNAEHAPNRTVSIRDRLKNVRDRLIADERAQRFIKSFPLTRPIARRKASQLFDLCAGFVYSQTLLACVRLNVTELLADGPRTVADVATHTGLQHDAAHRLVAAAVALELLEWRDEARVGLGELGAALNANPGVRAMVEHHTLLYQDLTDPVALLRNGGEGSNLNKYWSYATAENPSQIASEDVADYSDLMSASQAFISGEILDAYQISRHKRILDIGGGDGTFCLAAAAHAPALRIDLFDLPGVADRARARFAKACIDDRASAHGGDFYRDALPTGADLVSLVRIMFDHNDENARKILAAARKAIAPGGRILVAEPMARTPGAEVVGDAYFGFYLLAMGSGRTRSMDEFKDMLHEAGFANARALRTDMPLQTSLMIADA